jgi:serine/threonine protein kinase
MSGKRRVPAKGAETVQLPGRGEPGGSATPADSGATPPSAADGSEAATGRADQLPAETSKAGPSGPAAPEEVDLQGPTKLISAEEDQRLLIGGLGSALLARQPTPAQGSRVSVKRVCPQCGQEFETDARFCPTDGASLRPVGGSDPYIGQTIGDRYHILSLVGEGGMGRVYLAEHVRMNRQCAVKLMRQNLVNEPDAAARFAREASNAARIIHPNVAAVFDYGETPERVVYLVMEFVDGEPLGEILMREKVLGPARAAGIISQVADALSAAHELGIVHRDLKPDNIIVGQRSGREVAKVVDFGIAKAIGEHAKGLTDTGMVIGTPEFMSPEQLVGDPVDARSDLYSLGCIAYLMLAGSHAADAPTRDAMLKRRLRERPQGPREKNPLVPPELDSIVSRLLATAARDRYQTAAEVRDELSGLRLEDRTTVRQRSFPPFGQWGRRRTASAAILAVALVATALLYHSSGTTEAAEDVPQVDLPAVVVDASDAGTPTADTASLLRPQPPRRDTTAPVAERRPATAPESGIRAPIDAVAAAIASGSTERLRNAFPNLSAAQLRAWEERVFREATEITARAEVSNVNVEGDLATADVRMAVGWLPRGGGDPGSSTTRYRARLQRDGGAWRLVELVARADR